MEITSRAGLVIGGRKSPSPFGDRLDGISAGVSRADKALDRACLAAEDLGDLVQTLGEVALELYHLIKLVLNPGKLRLDILLRLGLGLHGITFAEKPIRAMSDGAILL